MTAMDRTMALAATKISDVMLKGAALLFPAGMRDPGVAGALDASGRLQVLPCAFWKQFSQQEIALFCHRQALYCLPTQELVDWARGELDGRSAIEIGAGAGILGAALNIPATDNFMQERPEIVAAYRASGQPTIRYGAHVEKLDAEQAVLKHQPQSVVAAWVTHKWSASEAWREGNMFGVDEREIVRRADYVFVGHDHVHRHKPILDLPHETFYADWLVSRATSPGRNFIKIWRQI